MIECVPILLNYLQIRYVTPLLKANCFALVRALCNYLINAIMICLK